MIEVVAGVIYKGNKFLIAQRSLKKSQGGFWEFPGGKVEKDESYEDALKREIKEEFDSDIEVKEYLGQTVHHYPEKDIKLLFYKAELISENIKLLEHQDFRWITKNDKDNFEFSGADKIAFEFDI